MNLTKKILLGAAVTILFSLAAGCTNFGVSRQPAEKDLVAIVNPNPSQEEIIAQVYFVDSEAMYLEPEEVAIVKDDRSQAELLVERLIAGPTDAGHGVVIPDGTTLLSLEIVDGIAYVNFSKEVKTNHWGGSTGENMTIFSVVNTLTQLPEIEQVQFLLEGEKVDSIWGHSSTMEPFEYNKEIVAPAYR